MIEDIKALLVPYGYIGPVLFDSNMRPYCIKILVRNDEGEAEWQDIRYEEAE